MSELNNIALQIISNGKGILAADESTGTMTKRLESVGVESSAKNRLSFRESLFSASSMSNCIGGVILYDETINQEVNKKKIPEIISDQGTYPGIKVDTGAKMLAGSENEKITQGLDGLRERLKVYSNLGAKFTKWRGVYFISKEYPSKLAVYSNAHALARYAALVQEANMVPIVEPEVLMDGNHSAKECYDKTSVVIKKCFDELIFNNVDLTESFNLSIRHSFKCLKSLLRDEKDSPHPLHIASCCFSCFTSMVTSLLCTMISQICI